MYVDPIGGVSDATYPVPVFVHNRLESEQKSIAPDLLSAGFVESVAQRKTRNNFQPI
jgi:hypothetical protein